MPNKIWMRDQRRLVVFEIQNQNWMFSTENRQEWTFIYVDFINFEQFWLGKRMLLTTLLWKTICLIKRIVLNLFHMTLLFHRLKWVVEAKEIAESGRTFQSLLVWG